MNVLVKAELSDVIIIITLDNHVLWHVLQLFTKRSISD